MKGLIHLDPEQEQQQVGKRDRDRSTHLNGVKKKIQDAPIWCGHNFDSNKGFGNNLKKGSTNVKLYSTRNNWVAAN